MKFSLVFVLYNIGQTREIVLIFAVNQNLCLSGKDNNSTINICLKSVKFLTIPVSIREKVLLSDKIIIF